MCMYNIQPINLQALGRLHDESTSLKATSMQKKMRSSITQLLQSAQTPSCPSYSACSLLGALSQVNGQVSGGTHLSTASPITGPPRGLITHLLSLSVRPVQPAARPGAPPGAEHPRGPRPPALRGPPGAPGPGEVQRGGGPPAGKRPELLGPVHQGPEDLQPAPPRHAPLPGHRPGTGNSEPGLRPGQRAWGQIKVINPPPPPHRSPSPSSQHWGASRCSSSS